jgi:hypothetical protein
MQMKKLFLFLVLISGESFAQSVMETTLPNEISSKLYEYTKEHFQASYHGEFYSVRRNIDSEIIDDHKLHDIKIMHNPTLIYNPTKEWQALATAEFKFSDQPSAVAGATYPNGFFRALFTLSRKNILTEKENGIQLDAGIGRRQFNTGADQASGGKFAWSSYGNNRVFATVSKSSGKNNASLFLQYLNNDSKKSTASTWKNGLELVPTISLQLTERLSYLFNDDMVINTPKFDNTAKKSSITHDMNVAALTYQWNDKLSNYYQFKYEHSEDFTTTFHSQDDYFLNIVGVSYAFTPKAAVTFEVSSETFHAMDNGGKLISRKAGLPELALYLDYAI